MAYMSPPEVRAQFQRTVDEGEQRLHRTWPGLLATGMVGGIDIGIGVFALLLVLHQTHNPIAAGVAFGIGFIALSFGQSELFTENYFVPIAAVVARRASVLSIGRLWFGTAFMNLIGGWIIIGIVIVSAPQLKPTALETAQHYIDLGIGRHAFALAILGGAVITLMTWMERASEDSFAKVTAAIVAAFLLGAGELNHVIVVSLEVFAALHAGAPFGYADWAGAAAFAALGNTLGGIAFVTIARLIQVGRLGLRDEQDRSAADREEAHERAAEEASKAGASTP